MMVITVEIPTGRHPMRREIHVRNVLGPAATLLLEGRGEHDRLYQVTSDHGGFVGHVVHDRRDGAEKLAASALEHVAEHAPRETPL